MSRKLRLVSMVSAAGLTIGAVAYAQAPAPTPAPAPAPAANAPTAAATPAAQAAALAPAEVQRRAQVVAQVGDVRITVGQVEDGINSQAPFMRARYNDPAKRREFVDNLIRFELLAREAQRREYGKNREVVRSTKQNAVQQLIRLQVNDRITAESLPLADVEAYYNAHPEEFNRPELRRASHIVVATREEALALIPRAREADARQFRDLARETSLDTETKLRGGDLRYFPRTPVPNNPDTQIDPALAAAAYALREVGEVSQPIQLGERFSVIKLTGLRAAESRTLADADATIRMRLVRERQQSTLETFVTGLREQLHPEIHAELVEPIVLDPLPGGEGGPNAPGMPGMPGAPGAPGAPPGMPGMPGAAGGPRMPRPTGGPNGQRPPMPGAPHAQPPAPTAAH